MSVEKIGLSHRRTEKGTRLFLSIITLVSPYPSGQTQGLLHSNSRTYQIFGKSFRQYDPLGHFIIDCDAFIQHVGFDLFDHLYHHRYFPSTMSHNNDSSRSQFRDRRLDQQYHLR